MTVNDIINRPGLWVWLGHWRSSFLIQYYYEQVKKKNGWNDASWREQEESASAASSCDIALPLVERSVAVVNASNGDSELTRDIVNFGLGADDPVSDQ